jgi:membrane-associated phospholipid phosphatase
MFAATKVYYSCTFHLVFLANVSGAAPTARGRGAVWVALLAQGRQEGRDEFRGKLFMNIMAAIEEASSHSMLQALKEGMSGPLRPQWVQVLASPIREAPHCALLTPASFKPPPFTPECDDLVFWQAILFLAAGSLVNFLVPPHEKLIPATPDPSLSYPVGAQEFPEALLFVIAYIVPLVIIFSTARFFDKTDFCITALALTQSICMAMFSTTVAKKVAGRPRPCFYAMCGWAFNSTDAEGGHCTAPRAQQWESRQSFPSGHSSFSMAGLAFLAMYLLEKVDLLQRPPRYLSVLQLQAAQVTPCQ